MTSLEVGLPASDETASGQDTDHQHPTNIPAAIDGPSYATLMTFIGLHVRNSLFSAIMVEYWRSEGVPYKSRQRRGHGVYGGQLRQWLACERIENNQD